MNTKDFLADLKAQFKPELWSTDDSERLHYGRDWTYPDRPNPCAVVFPRSKEDVVALVKLARRHKVAIVPSGGRTGLSGGACALNGEVVLTLTKMNRIGAVDVVSRTVDVEAGAVTEAVEVLGAATALQTDSSERGQVIGTRAVVELPLNGRAYSDLALLTTGVLKSPSSASREGSFIVNGLRST